MIKAARKKYEIICKVSMQVTHFHERILRKTFVDYCKVGHEVATASFISLEAGGRRLKARQILLTKCSGENRIEAYAVRWAGSPPRRSWGEISIDGIYGERI